MAMKLNLKDFDFKQFMLQRGEWVGLAVALLIVLPALYAGARNALTSGSASANAGDLEKLAKACNKKIDDSTPPADADKLPDESKLQVRNELVEADKYMAPVSWFVQSSIEDTKRRAPAVLSPEDFQVMVLRGGMRGHLYLVRRDGTMQTVVITEKQETISPQEKKRRERLKAYLKKMGGANGPAMGGGMGGMMPGGGMAGRMGGRMGGGMMGGGMMGGGPMGAGGMGGRGGPEGMGLPGFGQGNQTTTRKPQYMDVDKLANDSNVQQAEDLYPVRMAIVTGTFPYKEQLEQFRVAMRKRNLSELMSLVESQEAKFEFAGFDIERRVLHLDGKQLRDWEKYDTQMLNALKFYFARAVEIEKEDPELSKFTGLMNTGILWQRPALELPYDSKGESRYPKVEIPSLKEAIAELEKEGTENQPKVLNKLARQLKGEFDPTNPYDPLGTEDPNKMEQEAAPKPPDDETKPKSATNPDDPTVPKKALVRFLDMTVEPGFIYEYRVRVRMHNPNFKKTKEVAYAALASKPYIEGEWTTVPRVVVPYDVNWYVVDDRPERERLNVQIQEWLPYAYTAETNKDQNRVPVADWNVLEKSPGATCYFGEYIGRPDYVQVPAWNMEKGDWELAKDVKRRVAKLLVDFTVRRDDQPYPALLIDVEGGKSRTTRFNGQPVYDDAPVQALVLTPEGNLEIHTNLADKEDPERKKRYEDWKSRLEDVRNPNKRKKDQNKLFDNKGPAQ